MPLFRHNSPYTHLSFPVWHIVTAIRFLAFRTLQRLTFLTYFSTETYLRFSALAWRSFKSLKQGMQKTFEDTSLNSPSEIHARAFLWTSNCLDDDHELERFLVGLPGFRSSKVVKDPLPSLGEEGKQKLFEALIGLLDHTISSELLPKLVKSRRAMMCKKAINQAHVPFRVIHQFVFQIPLQMYKLPCP